jgi:hypothetical protein
VHVAAAQPPHVGELFTQVVRKTVDHPGAPALGSLLVEDGLTDSPVQDQQLGVHDPVRAQPCGANLILQRDQQLTVARGHGGCAHSWFDTAA